MQFFRTTLIALMLSALMASVSFADGGDGGGRPQTGGPKTHARGNDTHIESGGDGGGPKGGLLIRF